MHIDDDSVRSSCAAAIMDSIAGSRLQVGILRQSFELILRQRRQQSQIVAARPQTKLGEVERDPMTADADKTTDVDYDRLYPAGAVDDSVTDLADIVIVLIAHAGINQLRRLHVAA